MALAARFEFGNSENKYLVTKMEEIDCSRCGCLTNDEETAICGEWGLICQSCQIELWGATQIDIRAAENSVFRRVSQK